MSCNDLGFHGLGMSRANLRVAKSQDTEETWPFPPETYDFTGWTGDLQIKADPSDASALLTVTETATAAGSVITFTDNYIVLLIKKADLQTLPDADDADDDWVGVYEWVLTDTLGLTQRLVTGDLIAEKGVAR